MPIRTSSSGATKGPATAPTSVSASGGTSGVVSVSFTAPSFSKLPITSYTVTSSSGATASGASSPITVTETVAGTYTYTVRASHANGQSAASSASNGVSSSFGYVLQQTFNATGNFTVPAGHTKLAIKGVGAGAGGLSQYSNSGGWGGGSGKTFTLTDVSTNGGTEYVVTIGAGGNRGDGPISQGGAGTVPGVGGVTRFGNLLTANGGGQVQSEYGGTTTAPGYNNDYAAPAGNVSANTGTLTTGSGGSGGKGAQNNVADSNAPTAGFPGTSGGVMNTATSADANVGSISMGGGGSGGGAGGISGNNNVAFFGSSGLPATGNGGGGGNGGNSPVSAPGNQGNAANAASTGGGGGGGGCKGYTQFGNSPAMSVNAGPGSAGGGAMILVYTKP